MAIESESEFNALSVKKLRTELNLTQRKFWEAVCVPNTRGCAYETGRTPIPAEVRRLLYLQYVIGLPTDITSKEIKELAAIASPARRAQRQATLAADFIDQAGVLLKQAKDALHVQ